MGKPLDPPAGEDRLEAFVRVVLDQAKGSPKWRALLQRASCNPRSYFYPALKKIQAEMEAEARRSAEMGGS
jgi:hypothetical protein